jgi:hypothetical protein
MEDAAVRSEGEERHCQQAEADDVDRAIDGDETEDESVSQDRSARGKRNLLAGLDEVSLRVLGSRPHNPVVAPQATVPSPTVNLERETSVSSRYDR